MPNFYKNIDVSEKDIEKATKTLGDYLTEMSEGFLNLPFDEQSIKTVVELKEKLITDSLKYIVVVGIGGSSLGTKAIYDALHGYFDKFESGRFPKIIFLDTIDPQKFEKVKTLLKSVNEPNEIIVNVISKSGTTLETITNFENLLKAIPTIESRLVITTGEDSILYKQAKDLNLETLIVPEDVVGRFSVFSPVGLFPLACLGFNIINILDGAMSASKKKEVVGSATFLQKHYLNGKSIHEFFTFEPKLESLGKWYEQLIAESLGKKEIGITPITSIGSTDLHSDAQLDIGGPENKMVTFLRSKDNNSKVKEAIYNAAVKMYKNNNIPLAEIEVDKIDEGFLGFFMQHKMIETALLGKLLQVDPFNQPNVEEYKKYAKENLKK